MKNKMKNVQHAGKLNKIAAALLLAVPGCVLAESSVVVYGRIHAGLDHIESSTSAASPHGESLSRVSDNSSKIGFRGREDLGNGNTAFFQIEGNAKLDDGTGAINSKDTFVGLENPAYGRIALGRFATPIRQINGYTNRFVGEGIQDDANISQLGGEGFNRRSANAVSYRTPVLQGFSATIYRASENEASNGDRIYSSIVQYVNGPIKGAVGYEKHKDLRPGFSEKMYRAVGNYNFGGGDVGVAWNRMVYDVASGDLQRDYFTITAAYKAGGGSFIGRFGIAGDVSGSAPDGASVTIKTTSLVRGEDSGAKQATLGYEYYMSKRSTVYAYYTQTNNDKRANYTFGGNGFASVKQGAKLSGVMLGVIHLF